MIGGRSNDLQACLPVLQALMTPEAFACLRTAPAPEAFLRAVLSSAVIQF